VVSDREYLRLTACLPATWPTCGPRAVSDLDHRSLDTDMSIGGLWLRRRLTVKSLGCGNSFVATAADLLYGTTDEWPALVLMVATDLMLHKSIMENG
jgi:hypothetical protein